MTPFNLAAVQADDALLDELFALANQAEDATSPDIDFDGVLARALFAWHREVHSEPMTPLLDTDTALAVVARARRPEPRRAVVDPVLVVVLVSGLILTVLLLAAVAVTLGGVL